MLRRIAVHAGHFGIVDRNAYYTGTVRHVHLEIEIRPHLDWYEQHVCIVCKIKVEIEMAIFD